MTEHKDPIVERAIEILDIAKQNIIKNRRYNGNGVGYVDYIPNGIKDSVRCILEPLKRVHVSSRPEQAADCVAYAALHVSWVLEGMPESEYKKIIDQFCDDFFKEMKRRECPKREPL